MPSLLPAALWYAQNDIPVFPLQPGDKRPLPGSHGFKDATCDPDQIREWWSRTPAANIGTPTGHRFDVIDADSKDMLNPALEIAARQDCWIIGIVETPHGWHILVPPTGRGNTTRIAGLPIDYRGTGGYIVAPPSTVDGTAYRWDLKPEFEPGIVHTRDTRGTTWLWNLNEAETNGGIVKGKEIETCR